MTALDHVVRGARAVRVRVASSTRGSLSSRQVRVL